jgi:2-polyprenyl-6-methoxyphenol hydroxylase-like FAD-dependent oxidoreductase
MTFDQVHLSQSRTDQQTREEQGSMRHFLGRRAIVIGAGIGGLSVASTLAPFFEQVEIFERDRMAASACSRPGTPQDRHPHGLLAGGLRALGRIFPGFERDLSAAGAVSVAVARDLRYERPDVGALPQRDFGISLLCATRPLIELVLRRRAEAIANVVLRPQCRVTEIVPAGAEAVSGIRFDAESGKPDMLEADLVVDASGRGALTLALLEDLDWERPAVSEVGVDLKYATAVVQTPTNETFDWRVLLTQPEPPASARHAVLTPVEGNRWMILLADRGAAARLQTWDDFLEASRSLITPTLYNALRYAAPPEGIRHYGFPASCWRHFERLSCLPRGVLPVADAICRFNPIHGQGMSAAAQQALLLLSALGRAAAEPDPIAAAQKQFMSDVASVLEAPWNLATSADLAFPETRGVRPEKFEEAQQFEANLFRAVIADPVVHRAMIEVASSSNHGVCSTSPTFCAGLRRSVRKQLRDRKERKIDSFGRYDIAPPVRRRVSSSGRYNGPCRDVTYGPPSGVMYT